ncbi:tRNA pseudouridine synthase B [Fusobacterium sp. CAG:439]|nr:tRNA pseudouridine synthase B [Fusobacterium sp. CAG:439]
MFGFLNVYKPVGMTSHDVVSKLRKLTNIKQIGHTGTLDPFAEGVLPVCIGKATRLIEFLEDDKEYLATVQFGVSTTTYDREGEVIYTSDKKLVSEDVKNALKAFEGEISQLPPIYSAIKVKGKKLYEYARSGQEVEIKPRKVTIENIELKSFDEKLQQAEILIKCSKGTYIRSIANDLGQKLECGAHLIKLVRTQAGRFRIENSVNLEGLDIVNNLINPVDMLNYPEINVNCVDMEYIRNGRALKNKNIKHGSLVILIYNDNEICAVGIADNDVIKLKKVFL